MFYLLKRKLFIWYWGLVTEDEMVGWHHRLPGHVLSRFWEMVKDREAWRAAARKITKSQTRLSD